MGVSTAANVNGGSGRRSLPSGTALDVARSEGSATSVTGFTEALMTQPPSGAAAATLGARGVASRATSAINTMLVNPRARRSMAGS